MPKTNLNVTTNARSFRISAGHRGGMKLADKFRVSHFTKFDYVQGETLKRFWLQEDYVPDDEDYIVEPDTQYFLIYNPTENQLEMACDRCPTRHRPKNIACTANSARQMSPFIDPGVLYNATDPTNGPNFLFEIVDTDSAIGKAFVTGAWVRLYPK